MDKYTRLIDIGVLTPQLWAFNWESSNWMFGKITAYSVDYKIFYKFEYDDSNQLVTFSFSEVLPQNTNTYSTALNHYVGFSGQQRVDIYPSYGREYDNKFLNRYTGSFYYPGANQLFYDNTDIGKNNIESIVLENTKYKHQREWIYKTIWHLYRAKNATLLKAFINMYIINNTIDSTLISFFNKINSELTGAPNPNPQWYYERPNEVSFVYATKELSLEDDLPSLKDEEDFILAIPSKDKTNNPYYGNVYVIVSLRQLLKTYQSIEVVDYKICRINDLLDDYFSFVPYEYVFGNKTRAPDKYISSDPDGKNSSPSFLSENMYMPLVESGHNQNGSDIFWGAHGYYIHPYTLTDEIGGPAGGPAGGHVGSANFTVSRSLTNFRVHLQDSNITIETIGSVGTENWNIEGYGQDWASPDEINGNTPTWQMFSMLMGEVYPTLKIIPKIERDYGRFIEYKPINYFVYKNTFWTFEEKSDLNLTYQYYFEGNLNYSREPIEYYFESLYVDNARVYQSRPGKIKSFIKNYIEEARPNIKYVTTNGYSTETFDWHVGGGSGEQVFQTSQDLYLSHVPFANDEIATIIDTSIPDSLCYVWIKLWAKNAINIKKCALNVFEQQQNYLYYFTLNAKRNIEHLNYFKKEIEFRLTRFAPVTKSVSYYPYQIEQSLKFIDKLEILKVEVEALGAQFTICFTEANNYVSDECLVILKKIMRLFSEFALIPIPEHFDNFDFSYIYTFSEYQSFFSNGQNFIINKTTSFNALTENMDIYEYFYARAVVNYQYQLFYRQNNLISWFLNEQHGISRIINTINDIIPDLENNQQIYQSAFDNAVNTSEEHYYKSYENMEKYRTSAKGTYQATKEFTHYYESVHEEFEQFESEAQTLYENVKNNVQVAERLLESIKQAQENPEQLEVFEAQRIEKLNEVKQLFIDYAAQNYTILTNNFASTELIELLEPGQSYFIIP